MAVYIDEITEFHSTDGYVPGAAIDSFISNTSDVQ